MLNRVMLIGHVGQDPDIRSTNAGARLANFSLATSERWKDKASGERKERTEWHRVVIFNEALVGIVEQYVRKGSKLYVEGMLSTRKWTDNAGVERTSTEIVLKAFGGTIELLDRAEGSGRPPAAESADQYGSTRPGYGARHGMPDAIAATRARRDELDDEIPF